MSKRIFVLGAGFTAEYGLPFADDLTELMMEQLDVDFYIFFKNHLQILFPRYKKHLTSPPSLFELITLIQSSSKLANYLWPSQFPKKTDFAAFFGVIKRALARFFRNSVQAVKLNNNLDLLVRFCKELKPGDVIISFNWDCLLEVALEMINSEWTTFLPELGDDWQINWPNERILILKLHGSIDWIRKPEVLTHQKFSDKWIRAISDESYVYRIRSYDVCDIGAIVEGDFPIIHLPGEDIVSTEFQKIWLASLKLLLNAEEIIFIGYSMPAYDLFAKNLFLLASGRRRAEGLAQEITVINPDLDLKLVYEAIYSDAVKYCDVPFKTWLDVFSSASSS